MSVAPEVRRRKIRLVDFWRDNCAKSTAHKWINEGKLRAYKLGSMTFVDETFDEFVERQAAEHEAQQLQKRNPGGPPAHRSPDPTIDDDVRGVARSA
jgi:hypothetical protein